MRLHQEQILLMENLYSAILKTIFYLNFQITNMTTLEKRILCIS